MLTRREATVALTLAGIMPAPISASTGLPPALGKLETLRLATWDDKPTTLGQHLAPRTCTVIHFWAAWCAPCLSEAKHLMSWRRRASSDKLGIIGINVDLVRNDQKLAQWIARSGASYTLLRGDQRSYAAFGLGETIILPRLFVFGRNGSPSAAFGRYSWGTLGNIDRAIDEAMKT